MEFARREANAAHRTEEKTPGLPAGFCIAPWVQLYIATDGKAGPCCEYAGQLGSVRNKTISEIWSGEAFNDARRRFLAGEKFTECWKCFERESIGLSSLRGQLNRKFADHIPGVAAGPATPMPVAFDIRFTNLCNFRCRMCWHGSSSRWFADSVKLGAQASDSAEIRSFDTVEAMIEQFTPALPLLEQLYFAGGEPLLMEEHYALLRLLIERGLTHVRLVYNTNLSVTKFRDHSLFDLWNRFPDVQVSASADAAGAQGELIRKDLNWERFVANVRATRAACPHIRFNFETTVSALNVLYLADMFRELMDRCGVSPAQFSMHVLQEPTHYRVEVLPMVLKRSAAKQLTQFVEELRGGAHAPDDIERLVQELDKVHTSLRGKTPPRGLRGLRKKTAKLDKLRGEDSAKTLARLVPNLTRAGRLRTLFGRLAGNAT